MIIHLLFRLGLTTDTGSPAGKVFMINTDRVGFYRVDYDEYSQNLITQELNSGYTVRNPFT